MRLVGNDPKGQQGRYPVQLEGKVVAILTDDVYEDLELWYPFYRLQESGARTLLVGHEAGHTYQSKHGYPAETELAAKDAKGDDFDAVMIPGGYAPDRMRRDPEMVRLVADAAERGKVIAAICHGPWLLCSAAAVRDRRVTSFFSIKDDLRNAGAEWVDAEVVRDGNIITSRQPSDLPAFMKAVIEALVEQPVAV
jgi:protease I